MRSIAWEHFSLNKCSQVVAKMKSKYSLCDQENLHISNASLMLLGNVAQWLLSFDYDYHVTSRGSVLHVTKHLNTIEKILSKCFGVLFTNETGAVRVGLKQLIYLLD